MIRKSTLTLVHTFRHASTSANLHNACDIIPAAERDDFLPYVRNFVESGQDGRMPQVCLLNGSAIRFFPNYKKTDSLQIELLDGRGYLFAEHVGVLVLRFSLEGISEELMAEFCRGLAGISRRNPCRVCLGPETEDKMEISEWLRTLAAPWLMAGEDSFNPFVRSHAKLLVVMLVDRDYLVRPAFIEALLHNRRLQQDENGTCLPESIQSVRQSEHIETFGNGNGIVYLCRDDGTEFSRIGIFDVYGKNYLVTYLITVYQQFRLHELIEEASRLIITNHPTRQVKELKGKILTYLARTDFTQISHNPSRNLLYKFFRKTFEIRDLLEEVSTIVKKIDQEIEAEKAHIHTEKAHKAEKIALILEILILPYYLHHIIEMVLKHFSHDDHFVHQAAFWGTFGATALVIAGIQLLLRGFRK